MIEDKNFEEELLQKIKENKIAPKPKWHFLLKDYVIWTVGFITVALGALSVSLIIYISPLGEFEVYGRTKGPVIDKIFLFVPVFWLICLGVLTALIYYDIKHTKKGYRYSPTTIFLAIIALNASFGAAFYAAGFSEVVDGILGKHMPYYERMANPGIRFWSDPERGRLSGIVVSQSSDRQFIVVDIRNGEWKVFTDQDGCDAKMIEIGRPARFIGEMRGEFEFEAEEILPFEPGRGYYERLRNARPPHAEIMMEQMQTINAR